MATATGDNDTDAGTDTGPESRVIIPADLTWVKVNGGRAYAHIVNWDDDTAPHLGQQVTAADGGTERHDAVIVEVRPNGTLVLDFPQFAHTDRPDRP